MSNFLPSAGENSPHTGVLRISWEVTPLSPNGSYLNTPVDIGVLFMRTDAVTFNECSERINNFLNQIASNEQFIHIWKKGAIS